MVIGRAGALLTMVLAALVSCESGLSIDPMTPSPSAGANPVDDMPGGGLEDAREYADALGVTEEEAARRLRLQVEIDPLIVELRLAAGERWAAGFLEHTPEFRYVVRLTEPAPDLVAMTAGWPVLVHFIVGAPHTEADLLAGMEEIRETVARELPGDTVWPDLETMSLVLEGPTPPSAQLEAQLEARAGVPIRYQHAESPSLLDGSGHAEAAPSLARDGQL